MVEINKTIIINDSFSCNDMNDDNSLSLNLNTCNESSITKNKNSVSSQNIIELKLGDSIRVDLNIKNQSSLNIKTLKINLKDCNNLKFISNSLVNIDTQETYNSKCINSKCFSINSLNANESINLRFYLKVSSTNAKNMNFNNLYNLITLAPQKYISTSNDDSLFLIKQASLKITENPLKGIIDIENLGTAPAVDIIYTFNIPRDFTADFSTIKTYLNNNAINVNYKRLNDCLFFKLPVIPEVTNNKISKFRIKFDYHDKSSIYITKMTLK